MKISRRSLLIGLPSVILSSCSREDGNYFFNGQEVYDFVREKKLMYEPLFPTSSEYLSEEEKRQKFPSSLQNMYPQVILFGTVHNYDDERMLKLEFAAQALRRKKKLVIGSEGLEGSSDTEFLVQRNVDKILSSFEDKRRVSVILTKSELANAYVNNLRHVSDSYDKWKTENSPARQLFERVFGERIETSSRDELNTQLERVLQTTEQEHKTMNKAREEGMLNSILSYVAEFPRTHILATVGGAHVESPVIREGLRQVKIPFVSFNYIKRNDFIDGAHNITFHSVLSSYDRTRDAYIDEKI